jgi:hypothetical protein
MDWSFLRRVQRGQQDRDVGPITTFGGIAQERPDLGVFHQEAPDPIRQGATPARPARWPIAVLTGIDPQLVAEGRFVAAILGPHPHASFPLSRMTPDRLRTNIEVPPHIAYGSLFTSYGPPYGME